MRPGFALSLAVLLAACSNPKSAAKTTEAATTTSAPPSVSAPHAELALDAGDDADAAPPEVLAGADFATDAKTLFRVAACGSTDQPVPAGFDATVVDTHCKELASMIAEYKKTWVDVAMPFIAKLRPKNLPSTVVYPFGGGDLLGALATYPDGTDFTTISLEIAADVRKVESVPKARLAPELARYNEVLGKLFEKAHSRTINLDIGSKSVLPGEIVFDLVALVVHGYEPTSLRYFKVQADGTPHYFEQTEIDAGDAAVKAGRKTRADMDDQLFSNMELRFVKKGESQTRILRHIAWNLDDKHLKADGRLIKFLDARGSKVSAMTKAASHLLWSDDFSVIRNWLATHTDWMISDTTGFPPAYAKKMGFVQDTYGSYTWPEPFGLVDVKDATDFKNLFLSNPHTDLSFRYGYPDKDHHGHIVVTRKP
ncbi:MAG TPA: hypothetical protein VGH28_27355 [Polyangiaceae bacterium]|jgi:hypothetical protein